MDKSKRMDGNRRRIIINFPGGAHATANLPFRALSLLKVTRDRHPRSYKHSSSGGGDP